MVTFQSVQCHPRLTYIFNFWHSGTALWHSRLSATVPECQLHLDGNHCNQLTPFLFTGLKFVSVVITSCMYVRVQVFSLVTFICATAWYDFVPLGGGWVQFVSMTALILTTFLYMLYVFRLTSKLSEQIPFKFTVSA